MNREIDIRTNFAREVELRKLVAEVEADRLPPHLLDVLAVVHAAHFKPATKVRAVFTPTRQMR